MLSDQPMYNAAKHLPEETICLADRGRVCQASSLLRVQKAVVRRRTRGIAEVPPSLQGGLPGEQVNGSIDAAWAIHFCRA